MLRESNTLDFDLLRSIVGNTGDSLPVEVVVPALEKFKETAEGHFVTEPVITRGDLLACLQHQRELGSGVRQIEVLASLKARHG